MMVAVGFDPRFAAPPNTRRVATAERSLHATRSSVAPQRNRSATLISRGLKFTAIVIPSLCNNGQEPRSDYIFVIQSPVDSATHTATVRSKGILYEICDNLCAGLRPYCICCR
jgi:hypothetical protein